MAITFITDAESSGESVWVADLGKTKSYGVECKSGSCPICNMTTAHPTPAPAPVYSSVQGDLEWLIPGMRTIVPCPNELRPNAPRLSEGHKGYCSENHPTTISSMIMHLNDSCGWTREEVADWLETLDVDLTFPDEVPERPERPVRPEPYPHQTAALQAALQGPTIIFDVEADVAALDDAWLDEIQKFWQGDVTVTTTVDFSTKDVELMQLIYGAQAKSYFSMWDAPKQTVEERILDKLKLKAAESTPDALKRPDGTYCDVTVDWKDGGAPVNLGHVLVSDDFMKNVPAAVSAVKEYPASKPKRGKRRG